MICHLGLRDLYTAIKIQHYGPEEKTDNKGIRPLRKSYRSRTLCQKKGFVKMSGFFISFVRMFKMIVNFNNQKASNTPE